MKYVFFDIECACVYKTVAKICAFGYVVCDENWQVIAREDILINPKGKFHLTDRKSGEGLVLPYEYEDFKQYPVFPEEYRKIKSLLEEKDTVVCGHATVNDVNYLNLETKRYRLPSFRFAFYDTQFFYMNLIKSFSRQFGLQTMAEDLGVEFTPHRAVDDAYATMRVCEAICKREKTDILGLASKYAIRAGRIGGYKITRPDSAGKRQYAEEKEQLARRRAIAHDKFFRFVNKQMPRRSKTGAFVGKVFCFEKELEEDVPLAQKLAGAIFEAGGTYTSHPSDCNVYISKDGETQRSRRAVEAGAAVVPLETLLHAVEG